MSGRRKRRWSGAVNGAPSGYHSQEGTPTMKGECELGIPTWLKKEVWDCCVDCDACK